MARDLSKYTREQLQAALPFQEGDVYKGQSWLDGKWVTPGAIASHQAGAATGAAVATAGAAATALSNRQQSQDTETAASLKDSAELSRQAANRQQTEAQRGQQIAHRNEWVEADKDAAAKAASTFAQKQGQLKGSAGGGAATLAAMNVQTPDAQPHRARADTQFKEAGLRSDMADANRENALNTERVAMQENARARNAAQRTAQATSLSEGGQDDRQPPQTPVTTPPSDATKGTTPAKAPTAPTEAPDTTPPAGAPEGINERVAAALVDVTDEAAKARYTQELIQASGSVAAWDAAANRINQEMRQINPQFQPIAVSRPGGSDPRVTSNGMRVTNSAIAAARPGPGGGGV